MENLHHSSPPLQSEVEIFKYTPQGFKCATLCRPGGKCVSMNMLQSLSPPAGTEEGGGFRDKVLEVSGRKRERRNVDI